MRKQAAEIGLAIIGGGRVGLFRGEVANRHPSVGWIGLAEKNPNRAGEVAPKIGADFVTQSHVELLKRPEVTCRHHRHRRTPACRADHGGGRARHSAADREAARHRPGAVRPRAQGDQGRQIGCRGRLHPALPPQVARRQGEGRQRRTRRRHARHLARVHEPPRGDRQLQAHRRSVDDLADGDLRHPRARHVHVVSGEEDAGRMLRALDRQGAWARSTRASTPPPA